MRTRRALRTSLLTAGAALALLAPTAEARSVRALYDFQNLGDGAYPQAALIRDKAGNFYGTTLEGGSSGCQGGGCGTAFKLAPDGTKTILHSFTGAGESDGSGPHGIVMDKAGNLYGTTTTGGSGGACTYGCGTIFKIAPDGTETVFHAFTGGSDGAEPLGAPIIDKKGNLYGTTYKGNCCGTVFRITPDGKEKVIYAFKGGKADGQSPGAVTLARDSAGNFYGTTQSGGAYGYGTVFKLSPGGAETLLYSFTGGSDGGGPYAGVIVDASGNLFGTTPYDGDMNCDYGQGCGSVFKLAPDGTETTLYTFTDTGANADPMAPLVMDKEGNLYGTTYGFTLGAVFKLTPGGSEKLLYTFTGEADGGEPLGGLILDNGRLYGTSQMGGGGDCNNGFGCGTVFSLRK